MKIVNHAFVLLGALACMLGANAQNYPNKPIRLIVPYAAGGSTDALARTLGQKLSEAFSQIGRAHV